MTAVPTSLDVPEVVAGASCHETAVSEVISLRLHTPGPIPPIDDDDDDDDDDRRGGGSGGGNIDPDDDDEADDDEDDDDDADKQWARSAVLTRAGAASRFVL